MNTARLTVYLDQDFDLHFEDGDGRRLVEHDWLREAGIAVGLILTDHPARELGLMMRTMCHDDVFGGHVPWIGVTAPSPFDLRQAWPG